MTTLTTALFAFAVSHSGLAMPADAQPPAVRYASECVINRLGAGLGPEVPCSQVPRDAFATYDDQAEIVYLPFECRGLKTEYCRMVLAHEFTHYIQDEHGLVDAANRRGCVNVLEPLAYEVGAAYMRSRGLRVPYTKADVLIASICPAKQPWEK